MRITLIALSIFIFGFTLHAQENESKPVIEFSGFVDMYYLYDFNDPYTKDRSPYVFAYNRHNEINLNLGYLKGAYDNGKVFANLALQTGTYARSNYIAEPPTFRLINEANVGVRLNEKWTLDAGIFPSHIGIESANNQNCYNLTRSLMADASPYFETGARLTYETEGGLAISGLVLNGWQNIVDQNSNKAIGTQINWAPNDKFTFNHSTFIGNEFDDSAPRFRYFQDIYVELKDVVPDLKFAFVFDFMLQEQLNSPNYDQMVTGALLLYYDISEKIALGGRLEHYNDPGQIINLTNTPNGFITSGASLNLDLKLADQVMWRFEGRYLDSRDGIFLTDDPLSFASSSPFIATSLSVGF